MDVVRANTYTYGSGAAQLATADPVASTAKDGIHMSDSTVRVPYDEAVRCPQCSTQGTHSTIRDGYFLGPCGSRWSEMGGIETGAACLVIEHLRDVIDELRFENAELRGEVAA